MHHDFSTAGDQFNDDEIESMATEADADGDGQINYKNLCKETSRQRLMARKKKDHDIEEETFTTHKVFVNNDNGSISAGS